MTDHPAKHNDTCEYIEKRAFGKVEARQQRLIEERVDQ